MDDVVHQIASALPNVMRDGRYDIMTDGIRLPVRYRAGKSSNLVVLFHGAVDRSKHALPKFQGFMPGIGMDHQLSIADPTLELDERLTVGWFAGSQKLRVQNAITSAVASVSENAKVSRRIYIGSSAGGYAALYYSWRDPGSICIAVNPQIDIGAYHKGHVSAYLKAAWPSANAIAGVAGVDLNLASCYASHFSNLVVYLQSCGDSHHFTNHFSKFVEVGLKNSNRFILDTGYWGIPGHSGSVPASAYTDWMRAALASESTEKQSVMDAYHAIRSSTASASPRPVPVGEQKNPDEADIRMSRLLREIHFANAKKA